MNSQTKLISVLWEAYFPKIRSGLPVYFAFHREQLIRIFEIHSIPGDPIKVINFHASQWFEIDGDIAVVRPEAFLSQWGHFSAVILLVAQQVLVVEDMAKDRLGFSEDAYFPRLRRAISPNLQERSQHPFGTSEEFDEIWRKFRSEILTAGGNERTITFFSGAHSNRNRSYPLSQALLSQEDVIKLIRLVGEARIFTLPMTDLRREINNNKARLSKRGQKTFGIPFLEERVYEQILAYKGFRLPEQEKSLVADDDNLKCDVKIYRDQVDFGTEEFRIGFFERAEAARVIVDKVHRIEFRLLLNRRNFLVFTESTLGDSWEISAQAREVSQNESLVFVATSTGKAVVASVLKRIYPGASAIVWQSLEQFDDLYIAFLDTVPPDAPTIRVRNGAFVEQIERLQTNRIVWVGGICVSERENKFLLRFMPDKYTVAGVPSLMLGQVKVNGRLTTFESFKSDLQQLSDDQRFEIETIDGKKGFLAVAVAKCHQSEKRGYALTSRGTVSAIVSEMALGTDSLQGFTCSPPRPMFRLQVAHLAALINDRDYTWSEVSDETLDWVCRLVDSANIADVLKSVIQTRLRTCKALPSQVIRGLDIHL